jgi:2',3'-cyclic-nucleotide 2'-phosphodiesterase (5'-nucleotidase family)
MVVEGVTPDPQVQALVEQYQATLDKELGQPIGTTEVALDTRRASVRSQETNFGNLVADVIRAATGADVAITNGGGIRGDKLYEAGTELTRKDILGELPFGNTTVLLELKGSDIEAALENGFSQVEERTGRFPQVSGMTVTYDPTAPAGERVEEVQIGGQPLDPEATYKLATNDFMADGGDGYAMFVAAPRLIDAAAGNLMASQVIEHVESAGSIAPAVEDRIREAAS